MSLSETFRKKSTEFQDSAEKLFNTEGFDTNPKHQVLATVGYVRASIYLALADLVDNIHLSAGVGQETETEKRQRKLMEFNHAVRVATAKGDWDEFNRLTDALVADADARATNSSGS